jgi:hypothetical protein
MLAKFVDRATMAFTKMNATDTPTVWRISARPVSKSNGLSKRPPPTPVRPETIAVCTVIDRPAQLMHASHKRATRREEGLVGTQTGLTICNLRARMVNVPMKRPVQTSAGEIRAALLVLIDLQMERPNVLETVESLTSTPHTRRGHHLESVRRHRAPLRAQRSPPSPLSLLGIAEHIHRVSIIDEMPLDLLGLAENAAVLGTSTRQTSRWIKRLEFPEPNVRRRNADLAASRSPGVV